MSTNKSGGAFLPFRNIPLNRHPWTKERENVGFRTGGHTHLFLLVMCMISILMTQKIQRGCELMLLLSLFSNFFLVIYKWLLKGLRFSTCSVWVLIHFWCAEFAESRFCVKIPWKSSGVCSARYSKLEIWKKI